MGTNADKHARQGANRNDRLRDARRRAASQSRRRRVVSVVAAIAGVAVILGGVLSMTATTGGDEDATTTSTTAAASEVELPRPEEGITLTEPTPCPPAGGSAKRVERFASAPPTCIDPAATYTAEVSTTEGSFTIALDAATAPVTVNNFVVLSRYHYYDGVPVHRVVPDFVIQAGDGDGAPWGNNASLGYTIPDELPPADSSYPDYSVAMANAGPDTSGSQFFVVLPGGGGQLTPDYSLFGEVTEGRDVVDAIGALGDPSAAEGTPTEVVVIRSIEITETPAG